jgi:predicted anti-sigma-YlaC factor YlaD
MRSPHLSPGERLDLHTGAAQGARRDRLAAHVEACGECREALEQLAWLDATLAEWPQPEPPADGLARVLRRVAEVRPARRRSEWLGAALTSLASVIAGSVLISAVGARLVSLPLLAKLPVHAPLQGLAGAGVAALALFAIGSLVTLALAPILLMEAQPRGPTVRLGRAVS